MALAIAEARRPQSNPNSTPESPSPAEGLSHFWRQIASAMGCTPLTACRLANQKSRENRNRHDGPRNRTCAPGGTFADRLDSATELLRNFAAAMGARRRVTPRVTLAHPGEQKSRPDAVRRYFTYCRLRGADSGTKASDGPCYTRRQIDHGLRRQTGRFCAPGAK